MTYRHRRSVAIAAATWFAVLLLLCGSGADATPTAAPSLAPTPAPAAVTPDMDAALECWYPFSDPANAAADWSAHGRTAQITGSPIVGYPGASGGRANVSALRVDSAQGTAWGVRLCPGMQFSGPFTIMFWLRAATTAARVLMSELAPTGYGYSLWGASSGIQGFGGSNSLSSPTIAVANQWQHVALSVSAWEGNTATARSYRDGLYATQTHQAMTGLTTGERYPLGINYWQSNTTCSVASVYCAYEVATWIAGFRIYSRALSNADIQWIRAAELGSLGAVTAGPTASPGAPTAGPSAAPTAPTATPTQVPTTAVPTPAPASVQRNMDDRLECMYTFEDGATLTDSSARGRNGITAGGGPAFGYPAFERSLANTSAMRVDRLQGTGWAAWLCPGVNHSGASTVTFWMAVEGAPGTYEVFSEVGSGIGVSTYNDTTLPPTFGFNTIRLRIGGTHATYLSYATKMRMWLFVAMVINWQTATQYSVSGFTAPPVASAPVLLALAGTTARGPLAFGRDSSNATCTATCMPAAVTWIDNLRVYSAALTPEDIRQIRYMDLNDAAATAPPSPPAMPPTLPPTRTMAIGDASLQCHYKFDPSAPAADSSGRGRTATITGAPVFGYPNLPGALGNVSAMRFDLAQGSAWSAILCPGVSYVGAATVSFWVAFSAVPNVSITFLNELNTSGLLFRTGSLEASPAAGPFIQGAVGAYSDYTSGASVPIRTLRWHHVAMRLITMRTTQVQYLLTSDGIPVLTLSTGNPAATSTYRWALGLGLDRARAPCTTACMPSTPAWITNVRVYASSMADIPRVMYNDIAGIAPDFIAAAPTPAPAAVSPLDIDSHLECWYPFDTANPGADWSSRGRTAEITGAPIVEYREASGGRANSSALRVDSLQGTAWGVKLCPGLNISGPYSLTYWIAGDRSSSGALFTEQDPSGYTLDPGNSKLTFAPYATNTITVPYPVYEWSWTFIAVSFSGRTATTAGPVFSMYDTAMYTNQTSPIYTGLTTGRWHPLGIGLNATGSLGGTAFMQQGLVWIDDVRVYSKALTMDELQWIRYADSASAAVGTATPSVVPTEAPSGPTAEPTATPTAPTAQPTMRPTTAVPTPASAATTPNLASYLECAYAFEDGAALTDDSTRARTGLTAGAPAFGFPALAGLANTSAMRIDRLQGTAWAAWLCPGVNHTGASSVSFWYGALGPSEQVKFISEIGASPGFYVYAMINTLYVYVTSTLAVVTIPQDFSAWVHLVLVIEWRSATAYSYVVFVDGVAAQTGMVTAAASAPGPIAFGRTNLNATCTTTCMPSDVTYIDNLRVYSTALTPADVAWIRYQDMNDRNLTLALPPAAAPAMPPTQAPSAVTPTLDASLECLYTFGDSGADTAADASGRGRTARIIGAPVMGFPAFGGGLTNTSAMRIDSVQGTAWEATLCDGVTHQGPGTLSFWLVSTAFPTNTQSHLSIITELHNDGLSARISGSGWTGTAANFGMFPQQPALVIPNQWMHVVVTLVAQPTTAIATGTMYVDGVRVYNVSVTSATATTRARFPVGLGLARAFPATPCPTCMPNTITWIDNVRVYSTGVTAADVAWIRYLDVAGLATAPVVPSDAPSAMPSAAPSVSGGTDAPSATPSAAPSEAPTTATPSGAPTGAPSAAPSAEPTTATPTAVPTGAPSAAPSAVPTTATPSATPTGAPSAAPSAAPTTAAPSGAPTGAPSGAPTGAPSDAPSAVPTTAAPSAAPSATPSGVPSAAPTTAAPSDAPTTATPSGAPTAAATNTPSSAPTTATPSAAPSAHPTATPSGAPTLGPTTAAPTGAPTTAVPSAAPSAAPSGAPTTAVPTGTPTAAPSRVPTARPTAPTYTVEVNQTTDWTGQIENMALAPRAPGAVAAMRLGLEPYAGDAVDVRRMDLRALASEDLYGTATQCRYPVSIYTAPLLGFDLTPSAGEPPLTARPVSISVALSGMVYYRASRALYHCVDGLWQSTVAYCYELDSRFEYKDVMTPNGTLSSTLCHATPFMIAETLGTPAQCIDGLYGCKCTLQSRYDTSTSFIGQIATGVVCLCLCTLVHLWMVASAANAAGGRPYMRIEGYSPSGDTSSPGPNGACAFMRGWWAVAICAALAYTGAALVVDAVTRVRAGDPDTRTFLSWANTTVLVWVCYMLGVTLVVLGAVVARPVEMGWYAPTVFLHVIGALLIAVGNGLLLAPTPGDTAFRWAWLYVPATQLVAHVVAYQEFQSVWSKAFTSMLRLGTLAPLVLFLTVAPCGTEYLD